MINDQLSIWRIGLKSISKRSNYSIGIWVHVEGNNTPKWDQYGFVLAPDNSGTLITDLKAYLDEAKTRNILVIFVLWNGAVLNNQNAVNLVWDDSKLQTYIDKALKVHFTLSNKRHRLKYNDLLFLKKIWPIPAFFCSYSCCLFNMSQKHRWCAWDSNPRWQNGRRRRIHWTSAAPRAFFVQQFIIAKYWYGHLL